MQEVYAGIISAVLGALLTWLKGRKEVNAILKSTRWEKIKGIGAAVAPALGKALEEAAGKTSWKWDDLIVAEVNRRLIGQAQPDGLDPEEKKKLLELYPAPPVLDGPKLDAATLDQLKGGA